jgi:tripartite-type tricarboxylate transporter receptor subunit TctC
MNPNTIDHDQEVTMQSVPAPRAPAGRTRRGVVAALVLAALAPFTAPAAFAQADYPNKPIRFIVAVGAGGATDVLTRRLAERVSKALGQPVVVENMPGASGVIAAQAVMKAPPDGYTILIGTNTTHAANKALVKNLPYDPVTDFEPVARLGLAALVLGLHPDVPAKSVQELIAYAKANPGKLTYASGTSSARVAAEMFKAEANIDMLSVPYKSNAQALNDVLGGQTSMIFGDIPLMMPQVKSGKVRGLGVSSAQRSALAPELPTIREAGLPGYELVGFIAAFAPAKTPAVVVQRLSAALQAPLKEKEFADGLLAVGVEPAPLAPAQLREFVVSETKKWGDLVRGAGIQPE